MNRVNASDSISSNLLFRNLFGAWPRQNLAQVYSGGSNGDAGYFEHYYQVNEDDRRFGKVFFRLKREALQPLPVENETEAIGNRIPLKQWVKKLGLVLFYDAGMYELIFRIRISTCMASFIKTFAPDVIFATGCSLGFSWLPLAVQKLTGAPICFHASDDWPNSLYTGQPLSVLLRPLVRRYARRLIANSRLAYGFSPSMCMAYQHRYKQNFRMLLNGDDPERFARTTPVRKADARELRIVYSGSLGHRRWESLLDLCEAVGELRNEALNIHIYAYALHLTPEISRRLQPFDFLHLPEHPKHEDLPAHLKAADILFLPESLNEREARVIRFSVSSKAHLYMMSERPVLVYSHAKAGISQYARTEGWALVVNRQDRTVLKTAILRLMTDRSLREELVRRGVEVARKNHDRKLIAGRFAHDLRQLAYQPLGRTSSCGV